MASDGYGYIIFSNEGLGSGGSANMQTKTITPTKNTQVAQPDAGYDGLSRVTVNPIPSNYIIPSGTKTITTNGTHDVTAYANAEVSISSDAPELQSKEVSYTPSETAQSQTVSPDNNYDGLSSVKVNVGAISSTYVGSGIARKSSTDMTVNGATVTAPAGYYSAAASKAVATGTAGTPTATKGSVSNHTISVTPSVINSTGYITGGTKNGTAVTVSASELVSGNRAITENGTGIDVRNYATVSVDVEGGGEGLDIPIFTLDPETGYITCNKTYAECYELLNHSDKRALIDFGHGQSTLTAAYVDRPNDPLRYYFMYNGVPEVQINYTSDGNISSSENPDTVQSATFTENGDYYPDGQYLWNSITVDVPPVGTDTSDATLNSGGQMLSGVTAYADGFKYTGTIQTKTQSDVTVSENTVTVPAGYYASGTSKTVQDGAFVSGRLRLPDCPPSVVVDSSTGAISSSYSKYYYGVKPVNVAGYFDEEDSFTIETNGLRTYQLPVQEAATITPTESSQTAVDAGKYTTGAVTVAAIPSDYIGSDITTRSSTDLTASGATVTVPAGYYSSQASKSVASGTAGTPTASKGTVTNHSISVTPSVTNTAGYISGGTKSGTAVTVSASELVSGNRAINANGTGIDVTNYATVSVSVPTGGDDPVLQEKTATPTESEQVITPDEDYDALSSVTVEAISSTYVGSGIARRTAANVSNAFETVSIPAGYYASNTTYNFPTGGLKVTSISVNSSGLVSAQAGVSSEGYVSYGDIANSTHQLDTQAAKTVTPSESSQTAVVAGKYTTGAVTVAAIPSDYVGSDITTRTDEDLTASGATVTVPAGYYAEDASKAVASGSASTPATTVTANPSISVNATTGVITATASATKSVTPSISAGYVSSGTAGTITVSGSNTSQLTVQAAKTVTPTEEAQTAVAAGRYTTGAVTVAAIPSDYVGSDITARSSTDLTASGATITVPAGYYEEQATKSVASGSAGTPTASKGTVSNHSISVTPSVTNTTGYITGGTKTGTAVTVSASELVSGNKAISESGNSIDVTNYATVSVAAGSATTPATTITANPSISVSSSGLITASVSASQNVTPTVSAGYVSSGTAGSVAVSGSKTQQLTTKGATTYNTSTTDQTIATGTYLTGTQTIKAVKVSGLSAANIANGVTVKVGDANDDDRITSVTGTLSFVTYYTGSSAPASSLGNDGDIYLQT